MFWGPPLRRQPRSRQTARPPCRRSRRRSAPALRSSHRVGKPWNRNSEIACEAAPISGRASLRFARRDIPTMADSIDLAALIRPDDRVAWSGGPMEPASLLGVLDRQLDRVPRASVLLN